MKPKPKRRLRGGTSAPCPKCGGPSRVIVTRRAGDIVTRRRSCLKRSCHHEFKTEETRT